MMLDPHDRMTMAAAAGATVLVGGVTALRRRRAPAARPHLLVSPRHQSLAATLNQVAAHPAAATVGPAQPGGVNDVEEAPVAPAFEETVTSGQTLVVDQQGNDPGSGTAAHNPLRSHDANWTDASERPETWTNDSPAPDVASVDGGTAHSPSPTVATAGSMQPSGGPSTGSNASARRAAFLAGMGVRTLRFFLAALLIAVAGTAQLVTMALAADRQVAAVAPQVLVLLIIFAFGPLRRRGLLA